MFITILLIVHSSSNLPDVFSFDSEKYKTHSNDHDHCGISSKARFHYKVGSRKAVVGAWPWVASLRQKVSTTQAVHFCGGTIITPRLVLTAAHCFNNVTIQTDRNYARRTGEVHIGQLGLTEQGQRIAEWTKVIIPSEYGQFRTHDYSYDIALLVLKKDIINNPQSLICLPSHNLLSRMGDYGTVVGWGANNEYDNKTMNYMTQITLPMIDPKSTACNPKILPRKNFSMILCIGLLSGGIDACQGYSGGSFVQQFESRWYSTGIVSHGIGCGKINHPGFYTRTDAHLKWLCEQIKNENETLAICNEN